MNTINQKMLAKIVLLLLTIFIVTFFGFKLFFLGRLEIITEDKTTQNITVVSYETGKRHEFKVEGNGVKWLSSGKYEVVASTPNNTKGSSYFIEIPKLLGSTEVTVRLGNQMERTKLHRDVGFCPIYTKLGELYSYSCVPGGRLFKHSRAAIDRYSFKTVVPGYYRILDAKPYLDGALAISKDLSSDEADEAEARLLFIKAGVIQQEVVVPISQLSSSGANQDNLVLSTDIRGGSSFALSPSGSTEALAYQNLNNAPRRVSFEGRKTTEEPTTAVSVYGNNLAIFGGTPTIDSEPGVGDEEVDKIVKRKPSKRDPFVDIAVYDTKTGKERSRTSFGHGGSNFGYCLIAIFCIQDGNSLYIYQTDSEENELIAKINSVYGFSPLNQESFVYRKDDSIFRFSLKDRTSSLVYHSSHHKLVKAIASPKGLLLYTNIKGSSPESNNHAFLLSDTVSNTNNFLDDSLPFTRENTDVRDMDFTDKTILITPLLTSYSQYSTPPYDQVELARKQRSILNRLKASGISEAEYRIIFTP